MAANSTLFQSIVFTLSGTTADTISIAGNHSAGMRIINAGSTPVWVRADGVTAVAQAPGCKVIPPSYGSDTIRIVGTQLVSIVAESPGGNVVTAEAIGLSDL